ncbi:hypothetical protein CR513_03893, partial [Mucuna pruriens]
MFLEATCPHHQISEQLLIQYFYEGLMMIDQNMIDVASSGALIDKTPTTTRHLISKLRATLNRAITSRVVNKVVVIDNLRLENQLIELTSLVRQLAVGQHQPSVPIRVCGICTFVEHPIDACPTIQETKSGNAEIIGSIDGYEYSRQLYTSQYIRPKDSDPHKVCLRTRVIINSRFRNTKHHHSNNNRFCSRTIHVQWKIPTKFEFHDSRSENVGRTTSHHNESATINWFRTSSLSNNFQYEREQNYHNNPCHSQSENQSTLSLNRKSTRLCSNKLEPSHYPFPPRQSQQGNSKLMRNF